MPKCFRLKVCRCSWKLVSKFVVWVDLVIDVGATQDVCSLGWPQRICKWNIHKTCSPSKDFLKEVLSYRSQRRSDEEPEKLLERVVQDWDVDISLLSEPWNTLSGGHRSKRKTLGTTVFGSSFFCTYQTGLVLGYLVFSTRWTSSTNFLSHRSLLGTRSSLIGWEYQCVGWDPWSGWFLCKHFWALLKERAFFVSRDSLYKLMLLANFGPSSFNRPSFSGGFSWFFST